MPYVGKKQWSAATNMAARKIQGAWRKKKARVVSVAQVARIARNVTLGTAETKNYLGNYTIASGTDNTVYALNLVYPISQGTNNSNVLGQKIYFKSLYFRGYLNIGNATSSMSRCYRLCVIQTKKLLVATNGSITATDVFKASTGPGYAKVAHVDTAKVSVLYDKTMTITPAFSNQAAGRHFQFNVPINKTKYFDDDNSGLLKDGNYYLIMVCQDGTAGTPLAITLDWQAHFKDE